jgi:hypothetical protein
MKENENSSDNSLFYTKIRGDGRFSIFTFKGTGQAGSP